MNFLTAILFFGIICTFAIYFGMTAAISKSGDGHTAIQKLNAAVYENEELNKIITEINFRLLRRVENDNVIVGTDGFLFEKTDKDYSYLLDYRGELAFSERELELIKNNIELRQTAYKNSGAKYILAVIPNSQTVYSENMPFYFGDISKNTRLSQLSEYLSLNGIDCVLDLTSDMKNAKGKGLLYNNTENSLNALGAYTVYNSVTDALMASGISDLSPYRPENLDFYSHTDLGKTVARSAGIQHLAHNVTVSLSSQLAKKYTSIGEYENFEITEIENFVGPSILIEYNGEWNRIVMQPYFSNTFGKVAYKANHMFSSFANTKISPDAVVQIICEKDLSSLLDPSVTMTYGAGFLQEGTKMRTQKPTVLGRVYLDPDTLCVFGTAERGSYVSFSAFGTDTVSQKAEDGRFFIEVDLPRGADSAVFEVRAKYGSKKQSDAVEIVLTKGLRSDAEGVAVGVDSLLFTTKYGIDGFDSISSALESAEKVQHLYTIREITQKQTQYIYTVVPSKLTVYREKAPELLLDTADKLYSLRKALPTYLGKDVSLLDLSEHMKNQGLSDLYYRTADVPTDKGAYQIYLGIIAQLGLECKADNIKKDEVMIPGGYLISALGLDTTVVHEVSEKYSIINGSAQILLDSSDDIGKKYRTVNSDKSLPTAIILHDEYGADAVKYLAENFSETIVYAPGDFWLTAEDLETLKPDYIIRIVGEDNIMKR